MLITAVDDKFLPEASYLIRSCWRHEPTQRFYLFLVNSSEERLEDLQNFHPNLIVEHVRFDTDVPSFKGIMCCARTGPIYHVLEKYKEPTIYLDSDIILMKPLKGLFEELKTYDLLVSYHPQAKVKGAGGTEHTGKFNSGVIALSPTEAGLQFVRQYHRRVQDWIESGRPVDIPPEENNGIYACIDQEFLYTVYEEFKDKLKFKALPDKFNDTRFRPASVVWHGKGVARKCLPYVMAKLSMDNHFMYYLFALIRYPLSFTYYHLQKAVLAYKRKKR